MKTKPSKTIFLVDDNRIYMRALEKVLSDSNEYLFTIKKFETGEECLDHINEVPDVVILDYYLNSVDCKARNGISILKSIKFRCPYSTVLLLSGQEKIEIAIDAVNSGADEYFVKNEKAFEKIKYFISSFFKASTEEVQEDDKYTREKAVAGIISLTILIYLILNLTF